MKANALKAWLRSLPIALGLPGIFWAVVALYRGEPVSRIPILVSGPLLIQLIAYALTGLPIFLLCHRNSDSPIWMLPFALVAGTLLGACAVALIVPMPVYTILGAAYGLVTAIAAWLQRPRHHENAHHLP
ncbi:MAG: hypothetical protein EOP87_05150 [Verrucomicrobiaceae bacterium]|nr:MAG: hypothetical protein EOP87_05150 [Verrucomicrobiaceae bacterium]